VNDGSSHPLLFDGPVTAPLTIVLAHGAGAPMDSPFMEQMAQRLGRGGLRVARFEFPYMRERRHSGRRRPPDDNSVLERCWREVIDHLRAQLGNNDVVIGGKSLGGRIASMVADGAGVRGLVCLGYPFHPPGRPERPRIAHLLELKTPALIIQGTRDPFGRPDEIAGYGLPPSIEIRFIEGGDHSFGPRDNIEQVAEAVLRFARHSST
jgi:predicted alpha/beta-hydrolase family hydrolase